MYILASPGRDKTLCLREALRYFYSERSREDIPELGKLVVMCVSFIGYLEPTPADLDAVKATRDLRILLYTRLIFCAMAEFGAQPDVNFGAFAAVVAADLKKGRTCMSTVQEEVERKIRDSCRAKHLVLILDDINKIGHGPGGAGVSEELEADARGIVRSEVCRLVSTIGREFTLFTSLERGLMQAETSAFGRPGHAVGPVQLALPEDHVCMMVERVTAQQPGGLLGSPIVTRIFRFGQLFAYLGGGHWRAAELVAAQLVLGPFKDLFALCNAVRQGLPSTLLMHLGRDFPWTARKVISATDLSSNTMRAYVDDVLAAVVIQEEVQRDQPVNLDAAAALLS